MDMTDLHHGIRAAADALAVTLYVSAFYIGRRALMTEKEFGVHNRTSKQYTYSAILFGFATFALLIF